MMGLFDSLARIVTAPIEIVDKLVVEPVADAIDIAAEELGVKDRKK